MDLDFDCNLTLDLCVALVATVQTAPVSQTVNLVTFDGSQGTTFKWTDLNDPVMGGASTSTFLEHGGSGIFNGTCAAFFVYSGAGSAAANAALLEAFYLGSFHWLATAEFALPSLAFDLTELDVDSLKAALTAALSP